MEAASTSETSVNLCQTTRRNNLQDSFSSIYSSPSVRPKYRFDTELHPKLALRSFRDPQGSVEHSTGISELFKSDYTSGKVYFSGIIYQRLLGSVNPTELRV
jgi:hypothetical protein